MIVGNLGRAARATVDAGGALTLPDGVTVDWWVGAGDRWYVPSREITVRQSLHESSPIVRTAIRVPGGDVSAVCHAAVQGPRELVVLEIENRSSTPVALALVLRGAGTITAEPRSLAVDGVARVHVARAASARVHAVDDGALLAKLRAATTDEGTEMAGARCSALVLPLAHVARLRVAVVLDAVGEAAWLAAPVLPELPSAATVAKGWAVQTRAAASVVVGEEEAGVTPLVRAALLHADGVLAQPHAPASSLVALAGALGRSNLAARGRELAAAVASLQDRRGLIAGDAAVTAAAIDALWWCGVCAPDDEGAAAAFAAQHAAPLAAAVEALAKSAPAHVWTARRAADVFALADDVRAARDCLRVWERAGAPWSPAPLPAAPLPAASRGGALVPDDPLRLVAALHRQLDGVARIEADGGVTLLTGWEPGWNGQRFEAVHLPTPSGPAAFALRWHGARPALLWEVAGAPTRVRGAADTGVRITCAAFGRFTTDAVRGEALLGVPG